MTLKRFMQGQTLRGIGQINHGPDVYAIRLRHALAARRAAIAAEVA
jgi:hypothetical protein